MKDNKEIKDAKIYYNMGGQPELVQIEGVNYDIKAFELIETKDQVKTKDVKETKKK